MDVGAVKKQNTMKTGVYSEGDLFTFQMLLNRFALSAMTSNLE